MGTTLNGTTPQNTYPSLIKVGDNGAVDATLQRLSDGDGNDLPLLVSTESVTNYGGGAITSNTAFGAEALNANTTGSQNTAKGSSALEFNTTGIRNTAVGSNTLLSNGTGSNNTAIGQGALLNSNASNNTAIGQASLQNNTASNNTAVGFEAGLNNTSGGIVAIGSAALRANTTGVNNTAVGKEALIANTTASNNTAIGESALRGNTAGVSNTAIGVSALRLSVGSYNTAMGQGALQNNTTNNNTAVGYESGYNVTTGQNNTLLGKDAGKGITTGSGNTIIGLATGLDSALTNHIVLADGAGNQRIVINSSGDADLNGNKLTNFIPRTQAGGTLTIDSTNQDTYCGGVFEVTGAVNITIANSVRDGFSLSVIQMDANQCTFLASGGSLVLRNRQSHTQSAGQWATCSLFKNGNNLILAGDTA